MKRLSGRRKKMLVSPTPIDSDLSNLDILQVLNHFVDPNKIGYFFRKHKHLCKIYGSTKVNGKYLVKNGMYMTVKYKDGCQSWKTKWGLGARGFCAMWCTDHWEPMKIGMQTSFEIPNGVAAEDTQDGFSCTSNKFSQADICKINDFNKGVDDVTYTFKVDGQYLVANVYNAEMSRIILSVLHELYADNDATLMHLGNFGEKFADRFFACVTPTYFVVYGPANDDVRGALGPMGPMGAVFLDHFGGFRR